MPRINRWALFCATVSMLISAVAWAQSEGGSETPKDEAGVAAYIGGKAITIAELDGIALTTDMKLAQSLYQARQKALDQIILERLLKEEAEKQGMALEDLISKRVAEKVQPVTDAQVEAFYNTNRSRMGGKTLEEMAPRIRPYLASQSTGEAQKVLLAELKKESGVRITLEPPRAKVVISDNDPTMGPASAKVTIVEYAEFQ